MSIKIFLILNFLFFNNLSSAFFFKGLFFKRPGLNRKTKRVEDAYIDYLKEYNKYEIDANNELSGFLGYYNINNNNFDIFKKNYNKINEINNNLIENNNSFQLGFNSEFDNIEYDSKDNNLMNVIIPQNYTFKTSFDKYMKSPMIYFKNFFSLKKEFSWNNTDYLSPVKNQGRCGSCWAFASTNALESFMRSKNFNVTRLSEQELVDCSWQNYGCNGGFMHKAFDFIIENKGLVSDEDYPYKAITKKCTVCKCPDNHNMTITHVEDYEKKSCDCDDESCDCDHNSLNKTNILHLNKVNGSYLKDYDFNIPKSIIDRLLSLHISPITIAIDASSIYFRYYKSGVIDININGTQQLNHAVLLIGYGFDENGLYWIIQNSWGKDWGDNGYCKIRVQDGEGIFLSNIYGVYPSKI